MTKDNRIERRNSPHNIIEEQVGYRDRNVTIDREVLDEVLRQSGFVTINDFYDWYVHESLKIGPMFDMSIYRKIGSVGSPYPCILKKLLVSINFEFEETLEDYIASKWNEFHANEKKSLIGSVLNPHDLIALGQTKDINNAIAKNIKVYEHALKNGIFPNTAESEELVKEISSEERDIGWSNIAKKIKELELENLILAFCIFSNKKDSSNNRFFYQLGGFPLKALCQAYFHNSSMPEISQSEGHKRDFLDRLLAITECQHYPLGENNFGSKSHREYMMNLESSQNCINSIPKSKQEKIYLLQQEIEAHSLEIEQIKLRMENKQRDLNDLYRAEERLSYLERVALMGYEYRLSEIARCERSIDFFPDEFLLDNDRLFTPKSEKTRHFIASKLKKSAPKRHKHTKNNLARKENI
ncbi:hypothetical protein [Motiliproteus sediminis]|uniref:hypothetical protein n=1 Tax=Motiliproteus sediminis TaxID=1468178 RepID=UPI001AEFD60F|nr:hypothetical protein [Motiliproteus sediminis]